MSPSGTYLLLIFALFLLLLLGLWMNLTHPV